VYIRKVRRDKMLERKLPNIYAFLPQELASSYLIR